MNPTPMFLSTRITFVCGIWYCHYRGQTKDAQTAWGPCLTNFQSDSNSMSNHFLVEVLLQRP